MLNKLTDFCVEAATKVVQVAKKGYRAGACALIAGISLFASPVYAQVEEEAIDIESLGIAYGETAGNYASSVGGVVVAALGVMMAIAVVHVFRRWIGAKKA